MAPPATGVSNKNALPLSNDEDLGFPALGKYQTQAILRDADWLGVSARASNKEISDFVLIKLGLLNPADSPSVTAPYLDKITQNTNNFSRLFEEGESLIKQGSSRMNVDFSNPIFDIQSPRDLLEANLTLKDYSEYFLSTKLFPSQKGELNGLQRLRLTQTKFFFPSILSQEMNGEISVEDALLLITCLGLTITNKSPISVCDPATGNFDPAFANNMLKNSKLIFIDPNELLKSLPESDFDIVKDSKDTRKLFETTKSIVKEIFGSEAFKALFDSLSDLDQSGLARDLINASVDHEKVSKIINKLGTYFSSEQREAVLQCKKDIERVTQEAFKKCKELVENLPNQEKLLDELKNIEAKNRLTLATQKIELLKKKFDKFNIEIKKFLDLSSVVYKIKDLTTFDITWKVQGIEIKEKMEITKTCAISRRVFCPKISANSRSDLVYSSSDSNKESVLSRWKLLCKQSKLSDRQLAGHLLSLYQGKEIPNEFRPFLSFLMILLLGKEPMYDSASFAANFILLLSVKLGVHPFEEALIRMPLIPQGAIAAKQFLCHVSEKNLDALARVQYKNKQVSESTFLPTSSSFLGSAKDWIQVYDDVATTALECCRRLFFQNIDFENIHFKTLKFNLKDILKIDLLEIWDIPMYLGLLYERRELIKNPQDSLAKQQLDLKNECADLYLRNVGQSIDDENNAAEQCARFLIRGVDLNDSRIQELQQIIDKQDSEEWQAWMLSNPNIKGDSYEQMKKTIQAWNPSTVFRDNNIDPYDYSDAGISRMNKAWDDHFMQYMSEYKLHKIRLWALLNYRIPVYYGLPSAIDPNNHINSEDPLAKWAISHILDRHPLRNSFETELSTIDE